MVYKRNPGEMGLELAIEERILLSGGAGLDWQIGGTSLFARVVTTWV